MRMQTLNGILGSTTSCACKGLTVYSGQLHYAHANVTVYPGQLQYAHAKVMVYPGKPQYAHANV